MKTLAILLGKLTAGIGNVLGRGSALPGKLARDLDKDFLGKINMPKTIMVTGTNGKTSTSHFINTILSKKYDLIHNAEGANMPQGIASLLIKNMDIRGNVRADLAVLEVDEAFLHIISKDIFPEYLVLTNISQDQIDRFTSLKMVEELIEKGIRKGTKIIANGNDPSLVNLCSRIDNECIFFGGDFQENKAEFSCPSCGEKLEYKNGFYGNIGEFSCTCGLKTPELKYKAENIDLDKGTFTIDNYQFSSPYKADYMIYNLLSAISLAKEFGIENSVINDAIGDFEIGSGRMENINFAGHSTILNLVKNPAGLQRTLEFIAKDKKKYNIYLAINKKPADGEDISWLRNVDFSKVNPTNLVIDGEAKEEAKQILESMAIKISPLSMEELHKQGDKTYFLSNYTALNKVKEDLKTLE